MRARLVAPALACALLALAVVDLRTPSGAPRLAQARAEEGWTAEFEAVCGKTQDAMSLTDDELRGLVARCDALAPAIEALDPSRRKVYAKRLKLCRDLYGFVLASRQAGGSP